MDQTTKKGFFVGYNITSKVYRIYIPGSRKIIVRRDVKFTEKRAFKRSCELPIDDQNELAGAPLVQPQEQ